MNRHKITFAFIALTLLMGAEGAFAWRPFKKCGNQNAKWTSSIVRLYPGNVSFPAGSTWNNALGYVASRWRSHPSNLRIIKRPTVPTVAYNNGRNEVWAAPNIGAPAFVQPWLNTSSCTYVEMDMLFNTETPYTTSQATADLWGYGGPYRPFHTTAMHEFGHLAGLGHEPLRYNIMGTDWTHTHANCGTNRAYPGEDAVRGVRTLYGLRAGAKEELGIAHWRRTGADGGYSEHSRTRLLDTSYDELPLWTDSPEPVYRVNKGQQVRVEMSFEQMGKSYSLTTNGKVYLSTNNCISGVDTQLRSFAVTLTRDFPNTMRVLVTLPSNLTSGQTYWLGIYLDEPDQHDEYYDSYIENASYIAVRVN